MIKKILTTKPHLVVFFLGVIYFLLSSYVNWMGIGTWDLNRRIGWGWDITNYLWYYNFSQYFLLIIIPLVYWVLKKAGAKFSFSLIFLQVIIIILMIAALNSLWTQFLSISNLLLFFANLIVAIFSIKKGE